MILLINICKEKLHTYEFVKPIENILKQNNLQNKIKHYKEIKETEIKKFSKVIICGTSLKDNQYLKEINKFNWIKEGEKPILGICGGMQIIGLIYGGELKQKTEIGYYKEKFTSFLGLKGEQQVYHLHNNYIQFTKEFQEYSDSEINQAIKHKNKNIYGALFHPEVRQKSLITNFCKI